LPLGLRRLLGSCTIRSLPATSPAGRAAGGDAPVEDSLSDTVMRLRAPDGGQIHLHRPPPPVRPPAPSPPRAPAEADRLHGPGPPAGGTGRPARPAAASRAGRADAGRGQGHHRAPGGRLRRTRRAGDARAVLGADPADALPRPGRRRRPLPAPPARPPLRPHP